MKKILIVSVILLILLFSGCAMPEKEEKEPEVKVIEIVEEPEEDITEEADKETDDRDFIVVQMTANDMFFIPDEIVMAQDEDVKIIITSNFTNNDVYNFYAPALGIFELLNKTETEIIIPTEKVGTFRFWYNISPSDPRYKTMYGKIRIELNPTK